MKVWKRVGTATRRAAGSRERALRASESLAAVTAALASLEALSTRRDTGAGELNDWRVLRGGLAEDAPVVARVLDALDSDRADKVFHAVRCALGIAVLLPGRGRTWDGIRLGADAGLSVLGMINQARSRYGGDGSDQAALQVHTAAALARAGGDAKSVDAGLWYLSLQGVLSYGVSGWVKLAGRPWREGVAVSGVMRTHTYGHEGVWKVLRRHPRLEKAATASMLAFESSYPLVYVAGPVVSAGYSAVAMAFHAANGVIMGLGRFVWGFAAFHPAIAYTTSGWSRGRDRSDTLPLVAGAVLATAVAGTAVDAVRRRMRVLDGPAYLSRLTTRRGSVLSYGGKQRGHRTIVFLVNALFATQDHFGWITGNLDRSESVDFITYDRAGYGASREAEGDAFRIEDAVADLVDLVTALTDPGQRVILAGHSYGGEVIRRAAETLPDGAVAGLVFLDATHPAQFAQSASQREGLKLVRDAQRQMGTLVRAGLGVFLDHPAWARRLPTPFRVNAERNYRDGRMWRAGARELRAVETELDVAAPPEIRLLPGVEGLVISASRTMADPDSARFQASLASTFGTQSDGAPVVFDATHDTLLTDALIAGDVTDRILEFVQRTEAA
ncbi:alpha/beta fold hydrolase [Microbacterium sp. RURRCA19A]|uniref:alpha/beta fold hydrolase n=1 Tax=Microbacterium sp. RURRCA19A TaxID=1907391 RepID=UPI000955DD89|nr:alpha/beta fold hydrolase [Microbacterium sp. RURRCA19A]SIR96088.1 Alpha/beta hydrolase family protein [Microbacterium sp. RURRCA19A]